jgi:GxxExxY protein
MSLIKQRKVVGARPGTSMTQIAATSRNFGPLILYDGVIVGEFAAGLLLKDQVIAELKVVAAPSKVHLPRCRNDLRATGKPMCLLSNFGRPKVETRRVTAEARLRKPSPSSLLIR